ncbi:MAG: ADP-ribose pyrophosphatase [Candidatus Gottesmanbacteria bacterium GW2011_GWC2_39_8]|uniref:ADP-ribose pyrophosphatase n=1 Tax=Candidatus Gottesmanbacteria bacterium GW2011_GWC2_39_8 TaxID=1618450 RepID=A0A0G0T5V6_9BACT|nr:MAG: ADP-ribose pyrophosphatase [Candidatus Gottesmanbacteria bacterium GW2011_GWC2_39_8]
MITCNFENGNKAALRHVVADGIVIRGNEILLVKRSIKHSEAGKYGLPGGFLDRDETVKEGIIREVLEETGYKCAVDNLFRINDNPERPAEDRQNVEFVFLLSVLGKTGKSDDEVSGVYWFDLDKLPSPERFAFDHYQTLELYLKYKEEKTNLPIF